MTPIYYIRKYVFRLSQSAFSEIAGVTQATVSRWETNELEPDRQAMNLIREAALQKGLSWDDKLFFEIPPYEKRSLF
jgi:DNA-binding transcriptional regulator YiaG